MPSEQPAFDADQIVDRRSLRRERQRRRVNPQNLEPRAVDRVDDERNAEPGEHVDPMLAHRLQHREQRDACAERGEYVYGKCRRGARLRRGL